MMFGSVPLRVRLAIASDRLLRRAMVGVNAVHSGIWLGFLEARHLDAANDAFYQKPGLYSEIEYNKSGLSEWEQAAVESHFPPQSRVLVACAGAGREMLGLESLGYRSVGFDPSPYLVAVGNELIAQRESGLQLVLSRPDEVPGDLRKPFDAIVVGWAGYVHIRGRATRVRFLRGLRSVVDDGAPMLISFFLRRPNGRQFRVIYRIAAAIRSLRGSREPIELGDAMAASFDHCFTWAEIESELDDAGFAVVASSSDAFPHIVCRAV